MTDLALPLDRFRELAEAYGGVVARWPHEYRDAAMRTATRPAGQAILSQACALDATLDTWQMPAPAAALRARVLLGAPAPGRDFVRRVRLWWSGIGLAAALAGALAGAAVAIVAPIEAPSDSATSFGDVAALES